MADNFFKLKIAGTGNGSTVTYGSFNVQKPQNYTNNEAYIGQHPLTDTPAQTEGANTVGPWTEANAGKLLSCFEIDWGGAIEGWKEESDANWDSGLYTFPDSIKNSSDLLRYIFMLRWKLEHLKLVDDKFKVTANGLTATASIISGTVDLTNLQWTLSDSSTNYTDVKLDQTTGASVTLKGTKVTNNNPGTVGFTQSTYTLSGTSQTFEAKFTKNSIPAQLKGTVTATSPDGAIGDPNSVTLSGSTETIYGLEEDTNGWTWEITGDGAHLCTFGNDLTHKTTTITGGTKSQTITWDSSANGQLINISISNTHGSEEKTSISVNLPTQQVTYYWYVGNDIQEPTSTITITTGNNSGWRKIDKLLANVDQYTSANPLWNGANNPIQTGLTTVGCYLYLPKEYVDAGLGVYDGLSAAALDNLYEKTSRQAITIESIVYYEYFLSGVCTQFDLSIYKK